jgi:hypothetical protein
MNTISTILQRTKRAPAFTLLVITLATAGSAFQSKAQDAPASHDLTSASQVVWQHVGRIYLNPNTGKLLYVGYIVHIQGITSSLFNGAPSEATAHFTFSTDVSLTPMPNNGDVALSLVSPGTFSVYYHPHPNGDWNNPITFSSGTLIATFVREESLFPQIGPIGFHSLSESLGSSKSFTFNGQSFNFDEVAPHGITFAQFFSTKPLTGIMDYPLAFAGAGSTTAIGAKASDKDSSTR